MVANETIAKGNKYSDLGRKTTKNLQSLARGELSAWLGSQDVRRKQ